MVKRIVVRVYKIPVVPIDWREAEYAALTGNVPDTLDDRVSEEIFDSEDEWAEVSTLVHRMNHDAY